MAKYNRWKSTKFDLRTKKQKEAFYFLRSRFKKGRKEAQKIIDETGDSIKAMEVQDSIQWVIPQEHNMNIKSFNALYRRGYVEYREANSVNTRGYAFRILEQYIYDFMW